ncbi:MAG TPA: phosphotransferase [Pirellulales bacterium]|jgi:homoserine kinase type II
MADQFDYKAVLRAYPRDCQPSQVESLRSAGGFSGAQIWRLITPCGPLCLRCWPAEHPTPERLEFIQAVLWHVTQEGFRPVPLPLETMTHHGYVRHEGRLWQLEPWLEGEHDHDTPTSAARLRSAMATLARFHRAAASFPLDVDEACPSPGIAERTQQFRELVERGHARLRKAVSDTPTPHDVAAWRLLHLFLLACPRVEMLLQQANFSAPIQPCIRDVRRDSILFDGDVVSGLLDFGAMRGEHVSADVARLLGSLVEDDPVGWAIGLSAYASVRPLTEAEAMLITAFDASGVLLGGMNWLTWLYLEDRSFEDEAAVAARLDYFVRRLTILCERANRL